MTPQIRIDHNRVTEFCKKWRIAELAYFGSVLRSDFRPDSDIDILVSFRSDANWSLWDHQEMEEELSEIVGRDVDLVSRRAIEQSANWIRRKAILDSAQSFYVEG